MNDLINIQSVAKEFSIYAERPVDLYTTHAILAQYGIKEKTKHRYSWDEIWKKIFFNGNGKENLLNAIWKAYKHRTRGKEIPEPNYDTSLYDLERR